MFKKFLYALFVFLCLMGAISSVATLFLTKDYVLAVGAICVAVCAYPKVLEIIKKILYE